MNNHTAPVAPAIRVDGMSHFYGRRQALRELSFEIARGEIFAFLGPNGGGKTTLFRVLSTLVPCQQGDAEILTFDLRRQANQVRTRIGVVFQAASLDKKLSVAENIGHQAALYGIRGAELRRRQEELLRQLGLTERARQRVETLSGGLRRRVELAKGMIHQPELLLLDEPSTGLDPGARSDLWEYLQRLRRQFHVTVVLTTHLLDEAEKADRIAILDEGRLVALDAPDALRSTVGGDSITIETDQPEVLASQIEQRFQIGASVIGRRIRLQQRDAGQWIAKLVEAFPQRIASITLARPTLEDVFINKTGHRFLSNNDFAPAQPSCTS